MLTLQELTDGYKGRCASCGFLAKYIWGDKVPPPKFQELTLYERNIGAFENTAPDTIHAPTPVPVCYRQYANIQEESAEIYLNVSNKISESYKIVFLKERNCPKWMIYTPGFSPMEHLQELKMLELEQRRKEFEQKMEQDRRDFDFKIAESNKKFQKDLAESNKQIQHDLDARNRKLQYWITSLVVFIALVEIGVTVLQLVYPDGFPWLMKYIPREDLPLNIPGGF